MITSILYHRNKALEHPALANIWQEAQAEAVESIDLSQNQFRQFDLPAFALPSVKVLDLSRNQSPIAHLRISAAIFPNLEYLFVYESQVQSMAFEGVFEHLREVNLAKNEIKHIPTDFLDKMPHLEWLVLQNNPLKNIRQSVIEVENCLDSLKATLESFAKGTEKNQEIKLILMGNSTVGKTTLAKLLANEEIEDSEDTTHGILVNKIELESLEVVLYCWDFGGQEYYHATHRLFLSDNAVYCLLWNTATNQQGFHSSYVFKDGQKISVSLEHYAYEYWLKNIRHYASSSPILLVQSRKEPRQVPDNQILKEYAIPAENLQHICVHTTRDYANACPNEEISAEYMLKNEWGRNMYAFVEQLKALAQITAENSFTLGKYWVLIRDKIREEAEQGEYQWSFDIYANFCREIDPTMQDAELLELSKYLLEVGVILYYPDIEVLSQKVFIKPTWVTDTIYRILDYTVQQNQGEFDRVHVEAVLADTEAEPEEFIALMQAFELIFQVPDTERFIAPQYLPEKYADAKALQKMIKDVNHSFTIHYPDFLPKSTITRFIARYGSLAEDIYWKYGIVFDKFDLRGYVTCEFSARKICVHTQAGASQRELMSDIFQTLQDINEQSKNIEISANGEDFIKLTEIEEYAQNGILSKKGQVMDFSFIFTDRAAKSSTSKQTNPMSTQLQTIKDLLMDNQISKAITELLKITKNTEFENQIISLSGRWKGYERAYQMGGKTQADFEANTNQMRAALLYLISEMPDNQLDTNSASNKIEQEIAEIKALLQKVDKKIPEDLKETLQTVLLQLNENEVKYVQAFYAEMRKLSLEQLEAIEELIWQTLESLRADNQEVRQLLQKAEQDRLQTKAKLEIGLPYVFKIESEYPLNQKIRSFWTKFNHLIPQNLKRSS
ncbi:MAG: ADP-ribosylation factor-like protein [Microscillaceae bacterium]|jgi:hypothetical protein|nr:ADP-ribosylation factor-like protein [Microscillaceae bacterium]